MHIQVASLPKALVTKVALERLQPQVHSPPVHCEWSLTAKALTTSVDITLERFLLEMHGGEVNIHVILSPKALATAPRTQKVPAALVHSAHMAIQTPLLTKLQAALIERAFVRPRLEMRARYMAVVTGHTAEALIA